MITLTQDVLEACKKEAVRTYPNEGCGFVIGDQLGRGTRFVAVPNIQNSLHEKDPERFPRQATTAYAIDSKIQISIFSDAEKAGEHVTAIFHSHPDHDAYFSAEDRAMAAPWGEPLLPGLAYLVISVYKGEVKAIKQFYWDEKSADFVEADVAVKA